MCQVPLRSLRIYTQGLNPISAKQLKVEVFNEVGGVEAQVGLPNKSALIQFYQIGRDEATDKQGYSFPVIPSLNRSYRLSLDGSNPNLPDDWVFEFSNAVIGNRWNIEKIYLNLEGRSCGDGLVSSHHDRRFIWSGDAFLINDVWGNHGACTNSIDMPRVDCSEIDVGVLPSPSCSELCNEDCEANNAYCDCRTETCQCKERFMEPDCSVDLCEVANCGEHGHCTSKYLGATLAIASDLACICDDGWVGPHCSSNPCLDQGIRLVQAMVNILQLESMTMLHTNVTPNSQVTIAIHYVTDGALTSILTNVPLQDRKKW